MTQGDKGRIIFITGAMRGRNKFQNQTRNDNKLPINLSLYRILKSNENLLQMERWVRREITSQNNFQIMG